MHSLRHFFCFISLAAIFTLAGCATGPKFTTATQIPEGKALIYVYRTFHVGGVASSHALYANGEFVANLRNASYYPYFVTPGTVNFSSKAYSPDPAMSQIMSQDHLMTMSTEAGHTYYAQLHVGDTWGLKLKLVSEEVGAKRIQKCKLARELPADSTLPP